MRSNSSSDSRAYILSQPSAFRAGDLMQDLKTGALLKASPRSQFYGQMIGSLASVFVSAGAYKLYTRIYEVRCDVDLERLGEVAYG